ncbi:PEP-CTERM-box response regulator transcription factor [Planctomycetales bacterium 10988]|nr:PEP-CTERM-box response regulator transcription factor [Planctomycetales bacterium 10988]
MVPPRNGSQQTSVLIADDDPVTRTLLKAHLSEAGYLVREAKDGKEAIRLLDEDLHAALFDLQMPGATGMECLRMARERFPDVQVMMISGQGDITDAVEAMKHGAFHYMVKPFLPDELLSLVRQATRKAQLERDNRGYRQAVSSPQLEVSLIAHSASSSQVMRQVERIAKLDSTVLLTGASGTGKTTLARLIHQQGSRSAQPFISVSCATLPRDLIEAELFGHEKGAFTGAVGERSGKVELADGGTLFLDEIGDLPLELQPKLLTFLQDRSFHRIGGNKLRSVDVRVIAATHQDLQKMCEQKRFRSDLFYRLNVLNLKVPTLDERKEDLIELAIQTLDRIAHRRGCEPFTLTPAAQDVLLQHHWPGNIRELENVLERASAYCQDLQIDRDDLDIFSFQSPLESPSEESVTSVSNPKETSLAGLPLEEVERRAIRDTLLECNGNRADAARMLGVSERTVYNKIRKLGLTDLE